MANTIEICLRCSNYLNADDKESLQYLSLLELAKNFPLCRLDSLNQNRRIRELLRNQTFRLDKNFTLVRAAPQCALKRIIEVIPYRGTFCNRYPGHTAAQVIQDDGVLIKIYCCNRIGILDL
jgi:hypothetical protein